MTIHIFSHFPTIKGKKNENTPCLNQKPWALFLKIMKVTNMVVPHLLIMVGPHSIKSLWGLFRMMELWWIHPINWRNHSGPCTKLMDHGGSTWKWWNLGGTRLLKWMNQVGPIYWSDWIWAYHEMLKWMYDPPYQNDGIMVVPIYYLT